MPTPTPPMHPNNAQRLDEARLVEVLQERGMADPDALQELLQTARGGGAPFCEAAVTAGLVSDWEMSRVVAEMFQLPFLPVDICRPDPSLWEQVGSELLRESGIVPLRRFGQLLTVALPGLVNADVLVALSRETGCFLLPVVGTAQTNRRWVESQARPEPSPPSAGQRGSWGALFDEGEAAVQASLDVEGKPSAQASIEPPSLVDREGFGGGAEAHEGLPLDLPPPTTRPG